MPNTSKASLPVKTAAPKSWGLSWPWVIAIVIGGLAVITLSLILSLNYQLAAPKNKLDDVSQLITIKSGESIGEIANTLAEKNLIRAPALFRLYAKLGSAHGQLLAGTYEVAPNQSAKAIIGRMHRGEIAIRKVIISEGRNLGQTAAAVQTSGLANKTNFLSAASEHYTNPVLETRPLGVTSLEGYLAAGRYELLLNASSHALIEKMLTNFAELTKSYRKQSAPQGLSFYQALTLASVVEREASTEVDRKLIAGVFYNRLKVGMKLQSDPTAFYDGAKGEAGYSDINSQTPYNTYLVAGLPAGPIDTPSLGSIDAVYHPTASSYIYFIGDKNGVVHYATTYQEHMDLVKKYL